MIPKLSSFKRFSATQGVGALPAMFALLCVALTAGAQPVVFKHPFDGQPIATPLKDGEPDTAALQSFKATGVNGYRNDPKATAAGKELYEQWCQVCHNADGTGKMGPSLVGDNFTYPQSATDVGMFAVIYGGAAGAMQPFAKREITQDEILKVIAYVRSLHK